MKRFVVGVEIETSDHQKVSDAENRVKTWLGVFGHMASSYGFEFKYTRGAVIENNRRKRRRTVKSK